MKAISRVQLTRVGRNIQLVPFNQLKVNITTLLHSRVKFPHYHRFHVRVGVEEEEVRIVNEDADEISSRQLKNYLVLQEVWCAGQREIESVIFASEERGEILTKANFRKIQDFSSSKTQDNTVQEF